MINVEITDKVREQARQRHIVRKLEKQVRFLKENPRHPSLRFKPYVQMKNMDIWKFEIDLNWWGLTIKTGKNTIRIYNIIRHP